MYKTIAMKTRIHLFVYFIFLPLGMMKAQQLTPVVIASSGGFYSQSNGMLSFTTGEMASVETYLSEYAILTQGFQQPWDFGTNTTETQGSAFSVGIYPNPSDGYFFILTETEESSFITLRVWDVLGKEIFQKVYSPTANSHVEPINITSLPQGNYFLTIVTKDHHSSQLHTQSRMIEIIR